MRKIGASAVLGLIVVYGILKNVVLRIYSQIIMALARLLGIEDSTFFGFLRNQAEQDWQREDKIGWIIYYPTYFFLHVLFIVLLFKHNKKTQTKLIIGLTCIIGLLLSFWILFLTIGKPEIAYVFRVQFRKLFGLPFILLAIEGGRILYNDIITLLKERN